MKVSTLGIDLAKNVFQLHGVGCNGQTVLKKKLTRDKFLPFLMQLEPCLIGMEACASSHHFARVLRQYGHEVKLIPPQYVKPYVKTNKTDAADAEAICEAVARPNMRLFRLKRQSNKLFWCCIPSEISLSANALLVLIVCGPFWLNLASSCLAH
ncbi:transposase family protein [Yersinia enterocolitica]|nr:transposase family protein [Yersinia enterocolitica]